MRNGYNESEHDEISSQEFWDFDTVERKSVKASKIPPRASAHPSALPVVRPPYPRGISDQLRVTPFDGITSAPLELTSPTQRRTEDLLNEPIFPNIEDVVVSIDEMDIFLPDTQEHPRTKPKKAPYDPISEADTLPPPFVREKQQEAVSPPLRNQPWGELSDDDDLQQWPRSQGFSLGRYLDNIRWWLLFPGRLEFLLWLIGMIVLVLLTSLFLLAITSVWTK